MSVKILIADQNIENTNFLEDTLKEYEILITNSNKVSEQNLDLIIVSYKLLHSYIEQLNNKNCNIPIIVLIEKNAYTSLNQALDLGASDYISLPAAPEEIKARIRILLQQKQKLINANLDILTGLYNKDYFNTQIEVLFVNVCKTREELSLVMVDLDFFRNINDNHGHLAGDEVLKQIAQLMNKEIRSTDILARFGGEEFILVLPKTNIDQAYVVAERIRQIIALEFYKSSSDSTLISNTASFGITSLRSEDSVESFIHRADIALYQAKQQGRNMIVKL